MSRKKQLTSEPMYQSDESDIDDILNDVDCNIEANDMYLEAFKLNIKDEISYCLGKTAIYNSKAALFYAETDNKEIIKSSIRYAIISLTESIEHFERNYEKEGHQYIKSAKLVVISLNKIN